MPKKKLSNAVVAAIAAPMAGQELIWDEQLPGFGLRITAAGRRTYIAQGRASGRSVRVTLGRADVLTADQARALAKARLGDLASNRDVNADKKVQKSKSVSLEAGFIAFRLARSGLKARTLQDYQKFLDLHLSDWKQRPWVSITRQQVLDRHKRIGVASGQRTANNVMRFFRSLMNYCRGSYRHPVTQEPLTGENPVQALSDTKSWFPESRRGDYLKPSDIAAWWQAVADCGNDIQRDYLYAVLLTGVRGGELARIKWRNVDLKARSFEIEDSKNGTTIRLPLCNQLHKLLQARGTNANQFDHVFPATGLSTVGSHLKCANRLLLRVEKKTGIPMHSRHGLRRTYASIAESLGVGTFTIKRLLGHLTNANSDVTQGYVQFDVEALREPNERIAQFILRAAGVMPTASVTVLKDAIAV